MLPFLLQAVVCCVRQSLAEVQSPHLSLPQSSKVTVSEELLFSLHDLDAAPTSGSTFKAQSSKAVTSSHRQSWPLCQPLSGRLSSGHEQLGRWALHKAVRHRQAEPCVPRKQPLTAATCPTGVGPAPPSPVCGSVWGAANSGHPALGPFISVLSRSGNLLTN